MAKCEFHDDFKEILMMEIKERKEIDTDVYEKLANVVDSTNKKFAALQYWIMGSLVTALITLFTVLFKKGV